MNALTELGKNKYGEAAFEAYRSKQNGLTFDNRPIPQWADLPENIKVAWGEAANAVYANIADDLDCTIQRIFVKP